MRSLVGSFVSCLGIGYFPFAPGTAATIAGIGLAYGLYTAGIEYVWAILLLMVLGVPACTYMEKVLRAKDPGMVVIDEVIGILIGLWGLPLSWPIVIVGFFLFRAFDMFKIYPINRLESLPGGWGIMMDDVMAGLYTNIALQLAIRYAGLV
jgi:phosphatidylglycerophosphatase A